MVTFSFLDQTLALYPQRALYWQQADTLVVTDVHFGKAATFRAHGIALPAGTTQATLARLRDLLIQTRAARLLILGDLLHAKAGRSQAVLEQVTAWRQQFQTLAVDLVLGNHDLRAGRPPDAWDMRCVEELVEPPFVWRHKPAPSDAGYVVAGHVHPAVRLRGPGEQMTLPCFYFGDAGALLPAFGDFTGWGLIRPKSNEPVFVVAENSVIRMNL